jgi:hypothetical protein
MNDWLEIILYLTAAAVICGLRYLSKNLPRGHTHDPGTREIEGEDEQRAHVTQQTVRRPRQTWAKPEQAGGPTRSRFEPPATTLQTPMYGGRPARLWWLPEQEIPKAPEDVDRHTMAESVGCAMCGEVNPADSAFCGECGLFLEPPDSTTGLAVEQVTGRGQKAAGSCRNWQLGADRSVVKWRQGR